MQSKHPGNRDVLITKATDLKKNGSLGCILKIPCYCHVDVIAMDKAKGHIVEWVG